MDKNTGGVLQLAGITKFNVQCKDAIIPYNLEYDTGVTFWQILCELRDLYYPYEMFFDDDTFVFRKIPSGKDEDILLDNSVLESLVISESTNVDYSSVRNCVEVFGLAVEPDYYPVETSFSNGVYTIKIKDANMRNRRQVGFAAKADNPSGCKLKVINTFTNTEKTDEVYGPYEIRTYSSDKNNVQQIQAGTIVKDRVYVVEYTMDVQDKEAAPYWRFVGQSSTHAMIKLVDEVPSDEDIRQDKIVENCENLIFVTSKDPRDKETFPGDPNIFVNASPYSIDRIGRRNLVIDDDAIFSDELCMDRAEYELWKSARLTDCITLNTILIPWLEPNKKLRYKTKYNNATEETEYMIQSLSMNLGSYDMQITMNKFYPYYPELVKDR